MTDSTKPATPKRTTEEVLLAKWQHIVPGSLRFDTEGKHANKQTVEVQTRDLYGNPDGQTRRVATSDLHQCFWTVETKGQLDKARRSAKRKLSTKNRAEGEASLAQLDNPDKARVANSKEVQPNEVQPKSEAETKEERKVRLAKHHAA